MNMLMAKRSKIDSESIKSRPECDLGGSGGEFGERRRPRAVKGRPEAAQRYPKSIPGEPKFSPKDPRGAQK